MAKDVQVVEKGDRCFSLQKYCSLIKHINSTYSKQSPDTSSRESELSACRS